MMNDSNTTAETTETTKRLMCTVNNQLVSLKLTNCFNEKKKTIVYVDIPSPEQLGLMKEPPYGSQRGDGSANDKLWKEYNKLEKATQLQAILEFKQSITDCLGKYSANCITFKFSRKAGCSCGCSPGWLVYYKDFTSTPPRRVGFGMNFTIHGMNDARRKYSDEIRAERERREAEALHLGAGI